MKNRVVCYLHWASEYNAHAVARETPQREPVVRQYFFCRLPVETELDFGISCCSGDTFANLLD